MKKPSKGIVFFSCLEMGCLYVMIEVFLQIDRYPIVFILWSIPIFFLGVLTLKLKKIAYKFNLVFSPVIVVAYVSGIIMVMERVFNIYMDKIIFYILFIVFFVAHILFFSNKNIKYQFHMK